MNDLRNLVALQARVYEFLDRQDEATLLAIVGGTAQLAVLNAEGAPAGDDSTARDEARPTGTPATAGVVTPAKDPFHAAQHLSRLPVGQDRTIYLNATGLPLKGLRAVAKLLGLASYSRLSKPQLLDLLAGHGPARPDVPVGAVPPPVGPVDDTAAAEPDAVPPEPRPSRVASSPDAASPDIDAAHIASRLRETETEEAGVAYLRAQNLDRESLLAVATELQLTRVDRLSHKDLEKRVLKQAIGDRRKFAGLRKW